MEMQVNGDLVRVSESLDLAAYLQTLKLDFDRVVVEYNGAIVPREEWPEIRLSAGDRVEIVQFVGGG